MNVVDGASSVEHVETQRAFDVYPFGNARPAAPPAGRGGRDHRCGRATSATSTTPWPTSSSPRACTRRCSATTTAPPATLDAFAKGNHPPEPEVIRTPRSGTALTLRTAIHLPSSPAREPAAGDPAHAARGRRACAQRVARGAAAASRRRRLQGRVTSTAPRGRQTVFVTQADLGLQPIDLLYRAPAADAEQALGDLDDRILRYLHQRRAGRGTTGRSRSGTRSGCRVGKRGSSSRRSCGASVPSSSRRGRSSRPT